ncbi:hypothetical protein WMY97_02190 [Vibrio diabolicus]|uniref:hypothetical protein n=1 Tax=Vibrio diabolicus TaxID=50719 RepID=UPI003751797D|nr:hypothetical protein [Vibrio parahaemolyticus]
MKKLMITLIGIASLNANAAWDVSSEENPVTGVNNYYAHSPSASPHKQLGFPYRDVRSWLGVACNNKGEVWAYIGHNKANFTGGEWNGGNKGHDLPVRFDKNVSNMYVFEEGDFLHLSSSWRNQFIASVKGSSTLTTGLRWYKQGDVYFKYSLAGSTKAINQIYSKCGIK